MKSETFIEHLQNQNSDPNAPQCPQPQMKSPQTEKQVCERRGGHIQAVQWALKSVVYVVAIITQ